MKRSRLKLFKTTSLTISIIGVLLILLTVGVVGYVAVSSLSNSVSTTVSSGTSYDQLDQVKTQYNDINNKYEALNKKLGTNPDPNVKTTFNTGKVKLSEIKESISSIQNDINNGKSDSDIQTKLNDTKIKINEANDIYNFFFYFFSFGALNPRAITYISELLFLEELGFVVLTVLNFFLSFLTKSW